MYFGKASQVNLNEDTSFLDEDAQFSFDDPINEGFEGEDDGTNGIHDTEAMLENMIILEANLMNDEQRKAYMESDEFQNLVEAGVVGKRSVVRLNRNDDMNRRIHLLCLQKGKEEGDADWEALRKNRIRERQLLQKLYRKYGNRVRRDAVVSQRRIMKLTPKIFDMTRPIR
jgi:hypothetical protein|nr:MAG TPA: hypothetical protein [Caudoviricetes sp.]